MRIKSNIPNLITLLNLLCGSLAVILALSGHLALSSWLIILAAAFDFLDGFAARLLRATSGIGAQLDSLADVVSFGLAPAIIVYVLLSQNPDMPEWSTGNIRLLPFAALLLVAAGAYRLARFNTDPSQAKDFKGLPIPAAGLFIASLPLVLQQFSADMAIISFVSSIYTLIAIVLFLSWIMISSVRMMALKFDDYSLKNNAAKYAVILFFILTFIFIRWAAIPLSIIIYIIISVIMNLLRKDH
jgi:CDP-diacylglycerol--serine O-phosphatidyltransferase